MNNQFGLNAGMNTGFNVASGFNYVGNNANETLNNINSWQNSTKQKYSNAKTQEIANQGQNMFECAMRTNDGQVRKMNLSGANLNNMAILIKQTSNANGYHSYDDLDANQSVCRYLTKNPHRYQITQDTLDGKVSLDDWASIVGIKTGEDYGVEKNNTEEGGNFFTNVLKNYVEPFYQHGGQMINNLINGSLQEIEQGTIFNPSATDYTDTALENYAQMNYGTNFYGLTDEQKEEARQAVATDDGMEMYKPTVQRVLSKGAEAGIDAYFAIAGRPIMVLNSVGAEIPYVRDVIDAFGSVIGFGGYIINQLPILKQFRDSLQTEQEKEEWDQYVGGVGLWKLSGKKGKKVSGNIGDYIIKSIKDPRDIIKQFQEMPKKIEEKLPTAGETIASMNKMTLEDKMSFKNKYGQDYGDFLNEKGIIDGKENTIEKLQYMKEQNLDKIDNAIESIEGDFDVGNVAMNNLVNDVISYADATLESQSRPSVYNELKRIESKFRNSYKLNGKEVLYMLRYFRNNNKFAYGKAAANNPISVVRATNIESSVSRMLSKIAEENGFENMRDINMDISKSISVLNALGKEMMKSYGDIPFSDWLQFYSIKQLPANLLKTYLNSNRFKKSYAKWRNKRTGFEPKDPLNVDMGNIQESNAAKRVQRWYDSAQGDGTPRLNYEGPEVASDALNWAEMRAKDKPNPKDLVIETNAKDPWNVPKEVVEWQKVDEISQNPKDYRQKNLRD